MLAPPERRELKRRARKRSLAAESLGPPVKSRAHPQPRRPRPTRKRSVFTVILAFCFGQSSPTSDGGGKKLPSATQRKQSKLLLCFAYVSDQKESSSCILWLVEVLQQLKRANEAQSVGVDFITEAKSTPSEGVERPWIIIKRPQISFAGGRKIQCFNDCHIARTAQIISSGRGERLA